MELYQIQAKPVLIGKTGINTVRALRAAWIMMKQAAITFHRAYRMNWITGAASITDKGIQPSKQEAFIIIINGMKTSNPLTSTTKF